MERAQLSYERGLTPGLVPITGSGLIPIPRTHKPIPWPGLVPGKHKADIYFTMSKQQTTKRALDNSHIAYYTHVVLTYL